MITLTKEWLLTTIAELEEERDAVPGVVHEDAAMALAAMKLALASLEAEAVAYIRDGFRADGVHFFGSIITAEEHERTKPALSDRYTWKHQPLYTAPPAPVSMKDHQIRELVNELRDIAVEYHGTQQLRERIARTIRAAMLNQEKSNG